MRQVVHAWRVITFSRRLRLEIYRETFTDLSELRCPGACDEVVFSDESQSDLSPCAGRGLSTSWSLVSSLDLSLMATAANVLQWMLVSSQSKQLTKL